MITKLNRQAVTVMDYTDEDARYALNSTADLARAVSLAHMVMGDRADAEKMFAGVDAATDTGVPFAVSQIIRTI